MPGTDTSGLILATGGAPSPSDRVQMLSQPRRSSTDTPRSVHSAPEMATPVHQPAHWQPQHAYTPNVSSPHGEGSPHPGDAPGPQDSCRWTPQHHSQPSHPSVSIPVQDPALHAMDSTGMPYSSPYNMDNNARALSYPLDNPQLVTSQPMHMTGYNTPISARSPHPSDYQRQLGMPMNPHSPAPHQPHQHQHQHQQQQQHQHPQQAPQTQYPHFTNPPPQSFVPQTSHPGDMQPLQPLMSLHGQSQMMNDQGHIMYQHYPPNSMKLEHH